MTIKLSIVSIAQQTPAVQRSSGVAEAPEDNTSLIKVAIKKIAACSRHDLLGNFQVFPSFQKSSAEQASRDFVRNATAPTPVVINIPDFFKSSFAGSSREVIFAIRQVEQQRSEHITNNCQVYHMHCVDIEPSAWIRYKKTLCATKKHKLSVAEQLLQPCFFSKPHVIKTNYIPEFVCQVAPARKAGHFRKRSFSIDLDEFGCRSEPQKSHK